VSLRFRIKLTETTAEREQIHLLNYAAFVDEIPQHAPNATRRLVDRFDAENEYVIGVDDLGRLLGMLALRARRPFSLDQKILDLDDCLPPCNSPCELRLLAVRPEFRRTRLLRELLAFAARRATDAGHDLALISGTTRQLDLYRHLGFVPFGPLVGAEGATFQPMYMTLETFVARGGKALGVAPRVELALKPACFLPGPVEQHAVVNEAFHRTAISHRAPEFIGLADRVRTRLRELTGADDAALLLGSGTLANDVVAFALRGLGKRGVVLVNGEFGERLIDHAQRAGLRFVTVTRPWGEPLEEADIRAALRGGAADWMWAAHCETSTGVMNDLAMLKRVAASASCALCLDCMSTIGNLPLDLAGVRLASGSSGKGIAAYAGIAFVLLGGPPPQPSGPTPRYLDLSVWLSHRSVPYTHSSNLLAALCAALERCDVAARHRQIVRDARWLREALRAKGIGVLAPEYCANPAVATIPVPHALSSIALAESLETAGYRLSARSTYLIQRNWIQAALMGNYNRRALRELPDAIGRALTTVAQSHDKAA